MADLSQIPFGQGVAVYQPGPNGSQPVLLDSNECQYAITSGIAPHLLYVKAKNSGEGWVFTLESKQISQIREYDPDHEDYDPPRIVDVEKNVVRQDIPDGNATAKVLKTDDLDPDLGPASYTIGPVLDGLMAPTYITLQMRHLVTLTILEEIGTHIIPIAYHHIDGGDLVIEQVQHSDIDFWPVPKHGVWGKSMELVNFAIADTVLPPE